MPPKRTQREGVGVGWRESLNVTVTLHLFAVQRRSVNRGCSLMTRSVFAVIFTLTIVVGCGGSTDEPDGGTVTSGAADSGGVDKQPGGAADVHSCDVVTLEQLSETLGKEVIFDPSAGTPREAANCSYITTGARTIVFSINAQPATESADEYVGFVLENFEGAEPIDIGEGGYIGFRGAQVGFVQAGVEYQVDLGVATLAGDGPRELTIAVARLIESNV